MAGRALFNLHLDGDQHSTVQSRHDAAKDWARERVATGSERALRGGHGAQRRQDATAAQTRELHVYNPTTSDGHLLGHGGHDDYPQAASNHAKAPVSATTTTTRPPSVATTVRTVQVQSMQVPAEVPAPQSSTYGIDEGGGGGGGGGLTSFEMEGVTAGEMYGGGAGDGIFSAPVHRNVDAQPDDAQGRAKPGRAKPGRPARLHQYTSSDVQLEREMSARARVRGDVKVRPPTDARGMMGGSAAGVGVGVGEDAVSMMSNPMRSKAIHTKQVMGYDDRPDAPHTESHSRDAAAAAAGGGRGAQVEAARALRRARGRGGGAGAGNRASANLREEFAEGVGERRGGDGGGGGGGGGHADAASSPLTSNPINPMRTAAVAADSKSKSKAKAKNTRPSRLNNYASSGDALLQAEMSARARSNPERWGVTSDADRLANAANGIEGARYQGLVGAVHVRLAI